MCLHFSSLIFYPRLSIFLSIVFYFSFSSCTLASHVFLCLVFVFFCFDIRHTCQNHLRWSIIFPFTASIFFLCVYISLFLLSLLISLILFYVSSKSYFHSYCLSYYVLLLLYPLLLCEITLLSHSIIYFFVYFTSSSNLFYNSTS